MDNSPLYKRIAETVQQQILSGGVKPGDRLPSVRVMAKDWGCTIGTVQRAYRELARQGIVTMRSGQGTKVVESLHLHGKAAIRRATLIHRTESFLLELLTVGYSLPEVEMAIRQAMDRWRVVERDERPSEEKCLHFVGSHDLIVALLVDLFPKITKGYRLQVRYSGSLGGLIALAEGKADLAGSHLYDEESDSYNTPFVRRLLPGKRVALVTLAYRRIGLILPEGNPRHIKGIEDLLQPDFRFINRQSGSGTRVWLDMALRKAGIPADRIQGFADERMTHSAVAQAVAEGQADAAIGMEAVANFYSLDFIPLTRERYDLIIPEQLMQLESISYLVDWLTSDQASSLISSLGGYEINETGIIHWVE
jgi:molybdate-binding protein/DNA-binding transcriptional regulator YhcF (GntR family)